MAIRKLDFYEGAALHSLIRTTGDVRVRLSDGVAVLNEKLCVMIKYSARTRSPWSFNFSGAERDRLVACEQELPVVVGLVCGSDGVAALPYPDLVAVLGQSSLQAAVSCARKYDQHYSVTGPAGELARKIAPSAWNNLLRI